MDYSELLQTRGVSLADLGLTELGLKSGDALLAVELLAHSGTPVLGGDVYFSRCARIELAYANWSTRRRPDDTPDSFARRSLQETKTYISKFPKRPEVEPVFVFVLGSARR